MTLRELFGGSASGGAGEEEAYSAYLDRLDGQHPDAEFEYVDPYLSPVEYDTVGHGEFGHDESYDDHSTPYEYYEYDDTNPLIQADGEGLLSVPSAVEEIELAKQIKESDLRRNELTSVLSKLAVALAATAMLWVFSLLISPSDLVSTFTGDGDGDDVATTGDDSLRVRNPSEVLTVEGLSSPLVESVDGDEADAADETALGDGASGSAEQGKAVATSGDYTSNLAMIKSLSVRNTNHDGSAFAKTPSADLNPSDHYGPRSEYLGNPAGNSEHAFPIASGGQFRTACEFSHFGYDDPLIYPGQPGASHLHMFFGNTDVNAFSTYDTLINSGSSTCNGQELNRTGYWVPAMFDDKGNVRVPERVVVYYKGEGQTRGRAQLYPEGAAMIAQQDLNAIEPGAGGTKGKYTYVCSDNFSAQLGEQSLTMLGCDGNRWTNDPNHWSVLEVNVKFPTCWNGKDPSNIDNFGLADGAWYGAYCRGEYNINLPNLEYFVNYRVDPGENTANWFLSSDIDPTSFGTAGGSKGASIHGDWWGGWHKETNQAFLDNCVNYASGQASGCGFGYLTDGGPDGFAPYDGPALKLRPNYEGPRKIPAAELFNQLCPNSGRSFSRTEDAAYCVP